MRVRVLGGTRFVGRRVVADEHLPPDLALLGAPAQGQVVSTRRAEDLLGWTPEDPADRVAASVRWHVEHPSPAEWTEQDTRGEEAALSTAGTASG